MGIIAKLMIPNTLDFQNLIEALSHIRIRDEEQVDVDFRYLQFVIPQGMAALAAMMDLWIRTGHEVLLYHVAKGDPFRYLQRMNFFRLFQVFKEETFARHS